MKRVTQVGYPFPQGGRWAARQKQPTAPPRAAMKTGMNLPENNACGRRGVVNGLALFFLLAQPSPAAENMAAQAAADRPATASDSAYPQAQRQNPADADQAAPGPDETPGQEEAEIEEPEHKQPNRWSLTAGGSQRKDWLTGRNRWTLNEEFSAKKLLRMPDWLNGTLEHRTRYETYDVAWRRGQAGGEHQIPLQTVLWLEANHAGFRAGFEFWDARQFGAKEGYTVNSSMV
ncbi:MAG: hypothetical protein ACKN9W_20120, partial [Methylococcus sp.]